MWIDTQADSGRECLWTPGGLNYFYGVFLLGFLRPVISDLPGSQFIFSISQDPPMCAHTTLSQDGFYWRGIWVENIPWHQSPLAFREPLLLVHDQGGLLTSRKETCGPGRAQPPPLKVLLFLSFWSTRSESPIALPQGWEVEVREPLPPASPLSWWWFKNWLVGLVAKLCPTLATPWTIACQAPLSMGFPRQENWSGFLLQGIFLTQGSNPSKA